MSLVNKWAAQAGSSRNALEASARSVLLAAIGQAFWLWFGGHEEDVIVRRLFGTLTVRVKHVRPVFVLIFGEGLSPRNMDSTYTPGAK